MEVTARKTCMVVVRNMHDESLEVPSGSEVCSAREEFTEEEDCILDAYDSVNYEGNSIPEVGGPGVRSKGVSGKRDSAVANAEAQSTSPEHVDDPQADQGSLEPLESDSEDGLTPPWQMLGRWPLG